MIFLFYSGRLQSKYVPLPDLPTKPPFHQIKSGIRQILHPVASYLSENSERRTIFREFSYLCGAGGQCFRMTGDPADCLADANTIN